MMPKPVTCTEVAFVVLHVSVAVPPTFMVAGETLIAAVTPAAVTVTVAVRVSGPPLPCAVRVNTWVPAASQVKVWVPFSAALARPGPLTDTAVAFAVLHVSVVELGAVVVVGDALIAALTVGATGVTVTVAVRVSGPPGPCAVNVKVCVPAASPLTFWVPLGAVLASDGPETETAVALAVLHEIVGARGSVPLAGLAAIEPEADAAAETMTVAVCVTGPLGPCAVIV